LTGTYCAQGEYKVIGPDVAALDLFLNSPAGIKVLSTPPWWTLQRLLMLVGVLVCLLMATLLWITLLHRKVEQRTAELSAQIHEREHVEHLRAMEQERSRIAQDLHDQLGSDITAVGMLVERTKFNRASDEQRAHYMEQLGETARAMVSTLDEIVWAMNPQHDSLASLVGYLGGFAERFLALANITLRPGFQKCRSHRACGISCSWFSRKRSPMSCIMRPPLR
jgi:signal transduction histidine kinase